MQIHFWNSMPLQNRPQTKYWFSNHAGYIQIPEANHCPKNMNSRNSWYNNIRNSTGSLNKLSVNLPAVHRASVAFSSKNSILPDRNWCSHHSALPTLDSSAWNMVHTAWDRSQTGSSLPQLFHSQGTPEIVSWYSWRCKVRRDCRTILNSLLKNT